MPNYGSQSADSNVTSRVLSLVITAIIMNKKWENKTTMSEQKSIGSIDIDDVTKILFTLAPMEEQSVGIKAQ